MAKPSVRVQKNVINMQEMPIPVEECDDKYPPGPFITPDFLAFHVRKRDTKISSDTIKCIRKHSEGKTYIDSVTFMKIIFELEANLDKKLEQVEKGYL